MTDLGHGRGWLPDPAAQSVFRIDRRLGRRLQITSAARDIPTQQGLIDRWGRGGAANRPPNLYRPAMPASASPHVIIPGRNGCIDSNERAWLLANGRAHGWVQTIASDPVHYQYFPELDQYRGNSGGSSSSSSLGISDVRGLQRIAKMYGGNTGQDNNWGAQSKAGFAQFLRVNWRYVGNNELGPVMWAAIARWLRARWGYVGNDVPGPNMRAALQRASTGNL